MVAQNAVILRQIMDDWDAIHGQRSVPLDLTSTVADNAAELQEIDAAWRVRFTVTRLAEDPNDPGLFVANPAGLLRFGASEDPEHPGLWPVVPGTSLDPDGAHPGLYLING